MRGARQGQRGLIRDSGVGRGECRVRRVAPRAEEEGGETGEQETKTGKGEEEGSRAGSSLIHSERFGQRHNGAGALGDRGWGHGVVGE
jgi:hypothetical protein